jgi:iron complex outermembrane receptor protein
MRSFYGGVAALLLSTSTVFAAEPQITVNRGTLTTGTVASVAQAQNSIAKIPGAASVVDSKKFEDQYVMNFKDMLSETPGVFAQPRFGEEVRLSIRGSGISRGFHMRGITITQDGIPFNLADGSADFQELDPLILQHLEVYRGANALQYGATSLGGAINAVTPSARLVPYNYMLRMEGGSHGTLRLHAATAQSTETVDAYLAATKSLVDGYRDQSEQNNQRVYGNVGLKLSDKIETRFYVMRNDINQEIPGTISRRAALTNPKTVPSINKTDDYARDIHSLRISNKTTFQISNNLKLDAGIYANKKDLYHPIFEVIDQKSLDVGGFLRLDGKAGRNEYTLGLNGSKGTVDALRFVNDDGNRGSLTADAKQESNNVVLYGENRWFFVPDMALVTGAQFYRSTRKLENNLASANNDSKTFSGINPKVGMLWNILPTAQLYANVSKSSEVPTFSELVQFPVVGFVPLEEQTAVTYEIGSRGDLGRWSWDASVYHARVKKEMLQFTTTPSIPAATFNADNTIHQGLELGAGYRILDNLNAGIVYNFSDFRFDGDSQFGDNRLPGIPRHFVRGQIDYQPIENLTLSPNVEWIPTGADVDYANNLDVPGYVTLGMKADYKVTDNLTLFLDARNLTDEKTITNFSTVTNANLVGTNVFYPGEGRSVYGGFTVKF